MIGFARRVAQTRLGRAAAVGAYGQGIQMALQFLGVPLMISIWGLSDYGVWLILSAVPGYLVMADFGITTAASNEMIIAVTRGDRARAVSVYQAMRVFVLLVTVGLFLLAVMAVVFRGEQWFAFAERSTGGHPGIVFLALCGYGLVGVANGSINAAFRAADRVAFCGMMFQTIFLVESSMQLIAIALGGGLLTAALVVLSIRVVGSLIALALLACEARWLSRARWQSSFGELRALLKPGMASMVVPVANATAMQGSVVALSSVVGSAHIPIFTTTRTLTRFPLQFAMIISTASLQRFTVAHASEDETHKARLALLNIAFTAAMLVPAVIGLLLFGQWFLHVWTRGAVNAPLSLVAVFGVSMLANAGWNVLANFLYALNKQASFTYYYVVGAFLTVGLGYILALQLGVMGMALGSLALDVLMLLLLIQRTRSLGLLDGAVVRHEAAAVVSTLRLKMISRRQGS
jgi:O-antigen/teichoic acid export membrane protein